MDHEDSEMIYRKLEELEQGKEETLHIAKQQITLLKTNTNVMGREILKLTSQQNKLLERVNRVNTLLTETLKNTSNEIRHVHLLSEINEVALFTLNELQKISDELTTTFLVLDSLHRNELNPLMLHAKEFARVFEKVTAQRGINHDFTLAKVAAKVYSGCINDRIFIKVLIPLLENQKFNLNKVYTLPTPIGPNSFSILDDMPHYFANSTPSHKSFQLRELKFQTLCKEINQTFFICKLDEPIRLMPEENNCIFKLFRNPFLEPPECSHRILNKFSNTLVPMNHKNSWLYWIKNSTRLYYHCPEEESAVPLQGLGIFTLKQNCLFKIDNYIIPFKTQFVYQLSIRQPEEPAPHKLDKYKTISDLQTKDTMLPRLQILDPSALEAQLNANSKTIRELDAEIAQADLNKSRNILERKFNILSIAVGAVLVTLGLYKIIKFLFNKRNRNKAQNQGITRNINNRPSTFCISQPIVIPRREEIIPQATSDNDNE